MYRITLRLQYIKTNDFRQKRQKRAFRAFKLYVLMYNTNIDISN